MKFHNEFLDMYLEYVEDTESPRLFHIWSALSGASACLGRRVYLDFGISQIFANQYVVLCGPPAVRKNTAINIMQKLLKESTQLRFAPDDTGGKRQGLISAIRGDLNSEEDNWADVFMNGKSTDVEGLLKEVGQMEVKIDVKDQHALYAIATEFASFTGMNSIDMITFLNKLWDGEDYDYSLKNEQMVLKDPLLGILAASTPSNIADSLPPTSIGQGFTSRIIFVFANERYKRIPRPKELPRNLAEIIRKLYHDLYFTFDGPVRENKQVEDILDDYYDQPLDINDQRFVYYSQRRQQHLIKLAITLAATRRSTELEEIDIKDADTILKLTEAGMPEALGEFGLSPTAISKQKMVEFLQNARGPVSNDILWAVMSRDMKLVDFNNALMELRNVGRIMELSNEEHGKLYVYRDKKTEETKELWQYLSGETMQ